MIGIILPSRGYIFTEVLESIETMRKRWGIALYMSHNLPVPQAFNELTKKALNAGCSELLYVEEDTVPPLHIVEDMMKILEDDEKCGAVFCEYPLSNGQSTVVYKEGTKKILYGGLGCTMVPACVFADLKEPFFRSDLAFQLTPYTEWKTVDPLKQYGLYDVHFFCMVRKKGYTIAKVDSIARHLKVTKLGTPEVNGGIHLIEDKATTLVPSFIAVDPKEYF